MDHTILDALLIDAFCDFRSSHLNRDESHFAHSLHVHGPPGRMAQIGKPDLASRLDAVFGRLGTASAGPPAWSLAANSRPFSSGKADLDEYSSDDDAERSAPAPLLHGLMGDDDEVGEEDADEVDAGSGGEGGAPQREDDEEAAERRAMERFASTCSAHYRKAFEAEDEEDVFDRMAVGTWHMPRPKVGVDTSAWPPGLADAMAQDLEDDKPVGSMQVRQRQCMLHGKHCCVVRGLRPGTCTHARTHSASIMDDAWFLRAATHLA